MNIEEKLKHYQEFFIKVKRLVRNQGRSSVISISEIDELLNEYWIQKDWEKDRGKDVD